MPTVVKSGKHWIIGHWRCNECGAVIRMTSADALSYRRLSTGDIQGECTDCGVPQAVLVRDRVSEKLATDIKEKEEHDDSL